MPTEKRVPSNALRRGWIADSTEVREAVERVLAAAQESHEGMGICASSSGRDPDAPCGTKLFYRVDVTYAPEPL